MDENLGYGKAKRVMVIGLDGADPLLMKKLIAEGRLPNFKRFLELGTTTTDMGMIGALPTVTPPNWASLATGAWPNVHGITCFWNHTLGNPLDELDNGFNSGQCQAEFIWEAYAKAGKKSIVFNYPTAWPPTAMENVTYIDGSKVIALMDNYMDYEKIYHGREGDFPLEFIPHFVEQSSSDCFIEGKVDKFKPALPQVGAKMGAVTKDDSNREKNHKNKHDKIHTPIKQATGWSKTLPAGAKEVVLPVNNSQVRNYGLLIPTDGVYKTLAIYLSKKDSEPVATVGVGEWTDYIYDQYYVNDQPVGVSRRGKLMDLATDGTRMTFYYNHALNLDIGNLCYPKEVGEELIKAVGPQTFGSNALKYVPEGDALVVESFQGVFEWSAKALSYLMSNREWDLMYTHIHPIDLANHRYINKVHEDKRYLEVIIGMYEGADQVIGEMLSFLDGETVIFITSDHAAIPFNPDCEIPSLGDIQGLAAGVMEELGYCKLQVNAQGGYDIDWSQTQAISQRLSNIYLNVKGRDPQGIVEPEDYDGLVNQIIEDLYAYRNPKTGRRIVSFALKKNQMELVNLDGEHTGDIFFQLEEDFNREHGNGLSDATRDGFSLRCLFMVAGAGIKANQVIDRRVRIIDIVPTVAHLQGAVVPKHTEGAVVYQLFEA